MHLAEKVGHATMALVVIMVILFIGMKRSSPGGAAPDAPFRQGDILNVSIPEIENGADTYLFMFLSPTCTFCQLSVPLYKDISDSRRSEVKLVVYISSENSRRLMEQTFESNGIVVDTVMTKPAEFAQITSVPTLILADGNKRVLRYNVGLLDEELSTTLVKSVSN